MQKYFDFKYYQWHLAVLVVFFIVFGYGWIPVKRETKGPFYKGVWDSSNPYVQNNERVKRIPNFEEKELGRLTFAADDTLTVANLKSYYDMAKELEGKGWKVLSLANYRKKGRNGEPATTWIPYYIDPTDQDEEWLENWKAEICKNHAICGPAKQVSPDFTSLSMIILIDTRDHEVQAVRRLWKDLEGIKFTPDWKGRLEEFLWDIKYGLWEYDVYPRQGIGGTWYFVCSASLRTAMVYGFYMDSQIKSFIGYILLLGFLIFCFKGQPRYYWPIWISTMLTVVLTIGSIWPLHLLGLYQTPYTLPPITTDTIVALSFAVQVMEVVRSLFKREADPYKRLELAGSIINPAIALIAKNTVINFIIFGVYFHSLRRGIEMDAVFLIGNVWAWGMSRYFVPPLYLFFVRKGEKEKQLHWLIEWICEKLGQAIIRTNAGTMVIAFFLTRRTLWSKIWRGIIHVVPSATLIVASVWWIQGKYNTVSEPITYLPPKSNHVKAAHYANRPGGPGLDAINIMFGTASLEDCLLDRTCYDNLMAFHKILKENVPGIRDSFSIGQEIEYQLNEDPKASFESIVQEVLDAESDITQGLQASFNPPKSGRVVIEVFHAMETDLEMTKALEAVEKMANQFIVDHAGYEAFAFGEVNFYSEMAKIFKGQLPQFVWTSLLTIFLVSSWLMMKFARNERYVINPLKIGWILSQPFMFATGVIGILLKVLQIPVDLATAAIIPTFLACASDSSNHPTIRLLQLLKEGVPLEEAMREALKEKGESGIIDVFGNGLGLSNLTRSLFRPVFYVGSFSILALVICVFWSNSTTLPLLVTGIKRKEILDGTLQPNLEPLVVAAGSGSVLPS